MDEFEIKGRESVSIEEGKHTGKIVRLEKRENKEFVYLDVHVSVDGLQRKDGSLMTIKYGCPYDLTANTKLGKLLMNFGVSKSKIESGEGINIADSLKKGTKVQYLVQNEEGDKGGIFARIIDGSLKPSL
jgi:hypothetical protein